MQVSAFATCPKPFAFRHSYIHLFPLKIRTATSPRPSSNIIELLLLLDSEDSSPEALSADKLEDGVEIICPFGPMIVVVGATTCPPILLHVLSKLMMPESMALDPDDELEPEDPEDEPDDNTPEDRIEFSCVFALLTWEADAEGQMPSTAGPKAQSAVPSEDEDES